MSVVEFREARSCTLQGGSMSMPVVSLKGITKSYGTIQVLKDVSLDVEAGEVVAVIGRSGSGKSTMLRCINGLESIQGGTITVAGHVVTQTAKQLRELRREVGMVFQSFNLFPHLTVEQNISLAPRIAKKMAAEEVRGIACRVLEQVGLSEKIDAYPQQLSGGQQQRVAIARSLAMEPKVMLFDEVTSALDPELTGEVLKVMEQLAERGMTMIVVTHEMGFARHVADNIVFMHKGTVWEQGAAEVFFDSPRTPELQQFLRSSKVK